MPTALCGGIMRNAKSVPLSVGDDREITNRLPLPYGSGRLSSCTQRLRSQRPSVKGKG